MAPKRPDRLATYHAKRDFTVTPEPRGGPPPEQDGHRFVVQRHRARRLHYDLRLEVDGVLVSWAVPKGPTLDPKARHLAVHVEDHPLDYFDFEGTIPRGEYGGGDVIVWDWGTWSPVGAEDPAAGVEAGELHVDLHGQKLAGRFVLVRRGRDASRRDQWLLLHKDDEHAVAGWDPEDHPRSVKTGRTNDEVAADPDAEWTAHGSSAVARTWERPTPDELAALDALGAAGRWDLQGHAIRLTSLDKVLFPPRPGERAGRRGKRQRRAAEAARAQPERDQAGTVTKRDLVRYHACVAPAMLPYLVDRPVNQHRFPQGADHKGFWHQEVPANAPSWVQRWHDDGADPDEAQWYVVPDSPATLAWLANLGSLELHPWTSRVADVHRPSWAYVDIDPGTETTFDDALVLARLFRTALDHLGVAGCPKVTGKRGLQIWIPISERYTFDETRGWVEKLSRAVGGTVPELVSWEWREADRSGLVRLDHTQNAIDRTLVAPFSARPAPGAPVSVPITWDELDDPDLRPDRWTIRTVLDRLEAVGDPLAPLIGRPQVLPRL